LSELRLDILETREVKAFDPIKWLKEKVEQVEQTFGAKYEISNIDIQVSAGIPNGVSGSLKLTLTPKREERTEIVD
jgi:hypothetical protein